MKRANLKTRIGRLERRIANRRCRICEGNPSLYWWSLFEEGEEPAWFPADRPERCPGCRRVGE